MCPTLFMTTPAQTQPKESNETPVTEPDFALEVHQFWEKNRRTVLIACVGVVLAVAGYHLWQEFQRSREQGVREAFAAAAGSPAKLTAFANEHGGHSLAGVALLQSADASYTSGDYSAAAGQYQKAAAALTNNLLKSRAKLGAAVSKLGAGDQSGAEGELKALGADASVEKSIRAEALYQLATQLRESGRVAEARPLLDEIAALDATGVWGQRANQFKASLLMNESAPAAGVKP